MKAHPLSQQERKNRGCTTQIVQMTDYQMISPSLHTVQTTQKRCKKDAKRTKNESNYLESRRTDDYIEYEEIVPKLFNSDEVERHAHNAAGFVLIMIMMVFSFALGLVKGVLFAIAYIFKKVLFPLLLSLNKALYYKIFK